MASIGYTIEQHEERLARRAAELSAALATAPADQKARLVAQLREVNRQIADSETSWETRRAELAQAMARLGEVPVELPAARLEAARHALAEGDTDIADTLFAEVGEMKAAAMEHAATAAAAAAAFERGWLAEADTRWVDAATHFAAAARLDPGFHRLRKAHELAFLFGDYPAALRLGEELLALTVAEHGEGSAKHVTALNNHALTFAAIGRHAEAEPLLRQVVAISGAPGEEDSEHNIHLNNLGDLLRGMGRHAEAEQLLRQARAAARRRSTRTIRATPATSTISRCCCTTRAGTERPSRSCGGPWPSTRGRLARSIPATPTTSATSPGLEPDQRAELVAAERAT